ncbi:hypothetical protein HQ533_03850 [Candidatus Woesearchaeota archaeon]|nr:hypothetical protein [Candidatus Woesearchaeota archaeon]
MAGEWTIRTTLGVLFTLGFILIVISWTQEASYWWGLLGLALILYSLWSYMKTNH